MYQYKIDLRDAVKNNINPNDVKLIYMLNKAIKEKISNSELS